MLFLTHPMLYFPQARPVCKRPCTPCGLSDRRQMSREEKAAEAVRGLPVKGEEEVRSQDLLNRDE